MAMFMCFPSHLLSVLKTNIWLFSRNNGSLPTGDKGRKRSKYAVTQRPEPNGVQPANQYRVQTPQTHQVKQPPTSSVSTFFPLCNRRRKCADEIWIVYRTKTCVRLDFTLFEIDAISNNVLKLLRIFSGTLKLISYLITNSTIFS